MLAFPNAAAKPRHALRRVYRDACARDADGQPRGRLHDSRRRLGGRRWASKQWICCRLDFNGRHRAVWGNSYTELFFLDEVTALAAGHRPCFECRRRDAAAFAALFSSARRRASATEMDRVLHAERLAGKAKRLHVRAIDTLPDGAMMELEREIFAVRGDRLLRWTPAGYKQSVPRPRGAEFRVLTPPSILAVLARGYALLWHASAG